jgi:hypothetical protein
MLIECQRMWYQCLTSGAKRLSLPAHAGRYECGIHPMPFTTTIWGWFNRIHDDFGDGLWQMR